MPVVINEFEIVPDAAPPQHDAGARSDNTDAAKKKDKPHFDDILRAWQERGERVRAH